MPLLGKGEFGLKRVGFRAARPMPCGADHKKRMPALWLSRDGINDARETERYRTPHQAPHTFLSGSARKTAWH